MKSIDFQLVTESLQRMIGTVTKDILKAMYGVDFKFNVDLATLSQALKEEEMSQKKFSIKGKPEQVKSYIKATAKMKFFLDALLDYGDDHPMTSKRKAELDQAVVEFERETGVTWPFIHEG